MRPTNTVRKPIEEFAQFTIRDGWWTDCGMSAWGGTTTVLFHLARSREVVTYKAPQRCRAQGEEWVDPAEGDLVDPSLCSKIVVDEYNDGGPRDEPTLTRWEFARSEPATKPTTQTQVALVITRHEGLHQYLLAEGLVGEGVPVIDHATPDDVRGKHVIGVLPLHLAAEAASVTEVPLNLPADLRGAELTEAQVRQYAGAPQTYVVTRCTKEDEG